MDENLTGGQASNDGPKTPSHRLWRRDPNGIIGGVCAGIARRFDVEPWVLRLIWALSVVWFGTGLFLYVAFWLSLPRADDPDQGLRRVIFGVCARVAKRGDIDIAGARLIALLLLTISGGTALVGYVLLYFLLPDKSGPPADARVSSASGDPVQI